MGNVSQARKQFSRSEEEYTFPLSREIDKFVIVPYSRLKQHALRSGRPGFEFQLYHFQPLGPGVFYSATQVLNVFIYKTQGKTFTNKK